MTSATVFLVKESSRVRPGQEKGKETLPLVGRRSGSGVLQEDVQNGSHSGHCPSTEKCLPVLTSKRKPKTQEDTVQRPGYPT